MDRDAGSLAKMAAAIFMALTPMVVGNLSWSLAVPAYVISFGLGLYVLYTYRHEASQSWKSWAPQIVVIIAGVASIFWMHLQGEPAPYGWTLRVAIALVIAVMIISIVRNVAREAGDGTDTSASTLFLPIREASRFAFEATSVYGDWALSGDERLSKHAALLVIEAQKNPDYIGIWGLQAPGAGALKRIPSDELEWGSFRKGGAEVHRDGHVEWTNVSVLRSDMPAYIERLKVSQHHGPTALPTKRSLDASERRRFIDLLADAAPDGGWVEIKYVAMELHAFSKALEAIFNSAIKWEVNRNQAPIDVHQLTETEGIEVSGFNEHFVQSISEVFEGVGISDVDMVILPNQIPREHVKWPMTQRRVNVRIGFKRG